MSPSLAQLTRTSDFFPAQLATKDYSLLLRLPISLLILLWLPIVAQAERRLNLSHNQDSSSPVHQAMAFLGERLATYTDGELSLRLYPNSQLGSQRESMELMQMGAIDLVKSNASELEAFAAAYAAFNLPYVFRDRDHYYQVLDGEVGRDILQSSRDQGFIGLTYYDGGSRSFYANKPIRSPADLQGMKIRVQPSPSAIEMITLMGGLPTPLAYSELYTALQQSVVDGAENSVMALTKARHGEVAKVFSRDEHTMIPDVLLISVRSFDSLPAPHQAALLRAAKESSELMKRLWAEEVSRAEQEARAMGVTFVDVEKASFRQAVRMMHERAFENPELAKLVRQILATE